MKGLTLRDVIPQVEVMERLGYTYKAKIRRKFKPVHRVGQLTLYSLDDIGLEGVELPPEDEMPPIPLDHLVTASEMAAHMGWSTWWVMLNSDYMGGDRLHTALVWGRSRVWHLDPGSPPPRSQQCEAIAAKTDERCRKKTAGGRLCWLHSPNQASK